MFYTDQVEISQREFRQMANTKSNGIPALSVTDVYQMIDRALKDSFPSGLWVQGEIAKIQLSQKGHCYIDLVDHGNLDPTKRPTLSCNIWASKWRIIERNLRDQDITLEAGQVLNLYGTIQCYAPSAKISFIVEQIDVASLIGNLKLERDKLIKELAEKKLLEKNKSLALSPFPLRIALICSPKTEGARDFLGTLDAAGFSFDVKVIPSSVQGQGAKEELVLALDYAAKLDVDLVAIVRGGGSKTDLVVFDNKELAYKIANLNIPVFTGIGHTGDSSVADLVAFRSLRTPTACAEEIAHLVKLHFENVLDNANKIKKHAREILLSTQSQEVLLSKGVKLAAPRYIKEFVNGLQKKANLLKYIALSKVEREETNRLKLYSSLQLNAQDFELRRRHYIESYVSRLNINARNFLQARSNEIKISSSAFKSSAQKLIGAFDVKSSNYLGLLRAYNLENQLKRGWSITTDEHGKIIKSVDQVKEGGQIRTRVKDGKIVSTIEKKEAT